MPLLSPENFRRSFHMRRHPLHIKLTVPNPVTEFMIELVNIIFMRMCWLVSHAIIIVN